ncbi:MAG: reverse transcriptase domain-containing protein [Candidatus Pacearchaeota archaeon]|nr:reverse transcriptase domain-containing protein [Candidatus Pacearchaeota archaeon]
MNSQNFYEQICNLSNLILAWRKARKHKTKKHYVKEFEKDTLGNLLKLQEEIKSQTYYPKLLKTFILRDPKTRKISKADFRDRIVHHAICNIIEPLFDKSFIYDSCANRIGKGNLFAVKRFYHFLRKVTKNNSKSCFVLKADIKHYFQEVNHKILIELIKRKLNDKRTIWLIEKILENGKNQENKGMPLGNLTSQFFANIYLHELDFFIKHELKIKAYIKYVDDFVILHKSKEQLELWKQEIDKFLREKLKLELHPEKSRIISLFQGVDFVGFRCFRHFKLLRKRNIIKMRNRIREYKELKLTFKKLLESFQGWQAYAKWANSILLRKSTIKTICQQE